VDSNRSCRIIISDVAQVQENSSSSSELDQRWPYIPIHHPDRQIGEGVRDASIVVSGLPLVHTSDL